MSLQLTQNSGQMWCEEYLATIQAVDGSSTRLDDYRAGYLRTWRLVTENHYSSSRGFSLILDRFLLQALLHSVRVAGEL
jgi:hypothetical protein